MHAILPLVIQCLCDRVACTAEERGIAAAE
jgi:hypothetical protein